MCDDACGEGLQALAEEERQVKDEAKQDQRDSMLEPLWPGGRGQGQEDSVQQLLDRLGGRKVSLAGAQLTC